MIIHFFEIMTMNHTPKSLNKTSNCVIVSRSMYPPHHIPWYTEYKTTGKYMIRYRLQIPKKRNKYIYLMILTKRKSS